MINTYKYRGETWVDVDHGTEEEVYSLMDKYSIHPFVAKELSSSTPKPRIEFRDKSIYCILHFPVWKHTHSEGGSQEVDFIIALDTLITARYDSIDALHKFAKELEVEGVLEKSKDEKPQGNHLIFTGMLRGLYLSIFEELECIEDVKEKITGQIFQGKEKEMVIAISEVTRTLLDFKTIMDLHHEILLSLKDKGGKVFGEYFSSEMDSIILDYLKINATIKSKLEILHELLDTNNSLLTSKQNETIKVLTVVGAILFIVSIIVALLR